MCRPAIFFAPLLLVSLGCPPPPPPSGSAEQPGLQAPEPASEPGPSAPGHPTSLEPAPAEQVITADAPLRRVSTLFEGVQTTVLPWPGSLDVFTNANAPDDLERLEAMASQL